MPVRNRFTIWTNEHEFSEKVTLLNEPLPLFRRGLIGNDAFQVAAIVEKLPPLWKDFKNYLNDKCKEMTVEDLIARLRIEEDNKAAERRLKGNSTINEAHIVEDDQNSSKQRKKAEQGNH
ncbi:hypothetical protein CQW23_18677 [Capsicum baccatum]|uniref:Uncharacterized protein n=1 Tax=Capsicum baccatum TaxID=33114 RepID=A0A2G2W3N8_CAPBA|nr:hypothetical protein CQW23_18677 [Capsicum baccatum]